MIFRIDPTKRAIRSRADLHSDSKTLRYEFENLMEMAQEYSPAWVNSHPFRNNAYVEAFAVHCRALIYFLYGHLDEIAANGKSAKFSGEYPRKNDVLAYDFHRSWDQDCPPPSEVMLDGKWQADKHVAHITVERREVNQPGSSQESVWEFFESVLAISAVMACFLEKAPPQNFDAAELRRMKDWCGLTVSTKALPILPAAHPATPFSASWLQGKTDARTLSPGSGISIHGKTE